LPTKQADALDAAYLPTLIRTYMAQGHYADAELLIRRAGSTSLGASRAVRGRTTETIEIADVYLAQGRYAEAAEIYGQDLARLEAAYRPAKAEHDAALEKLKALGHIMSMDDIKAREPLSKEVARLGARVPSKTTMAA